MTNLPATTTAVVVPFDELQRMGTAIAKSGLFGMKSPEQAIALMLIAQAEGRHPAIVARDYDIIQGRPAKKAEAVQRDFIAAGGSIEWHALDDTIADASFSHPQGGKVRITWTMEQAKHAGLTGKDNWKKYPRAMLRARCVSEGCRTVCPSSTSGLYVPEEVQDFDDDRRKDRQNRDVSPAEGFAGAPPQEIPIGKPVASSLPPPSATPDADALLGDTVPRPKLNPDAKPIPEEIEAVDVQGYDTLKQAKAMRQSAYKTAIAHGWSDERMRLWLGETFAGRSSLKLITKAELEKAWERFRHAPPPVGARPPNGGAAAHEFADVPPGPPGGV